jgi:hypothetical protein
MQRQVVLLSQAGLAQLTQQDYPVVMSCIRFPNSMPSLDRCQPRPGAQGWMEVQVASQATLPFPYFTVHARGDALIPVVVSHLMHACVLVPPQCCCISLPVVSLCLLRSVTLGCQQCYLPTAVSLVGSSKVGCEGRHHA